MKTFNIAYSSSANTTSLLETLLTHGTVLYHLEGVRVVGLEVADDFSVETLESIEGVILVELDTETTVTSHAEWHQFRLVTDALPMKQLYNPLTEGTDSIVYLMDSGVDDTHAEFNGSNIEHLYSYNGDSSDVVGHGTSIASVINGQTVGVSKNAIIKSVKIPFGSVTIGQLLTAFNAVLENHLLTPTVVKVVNCSWSVPKSALLDSKVTELQNTGLVVVAAAGNTGIAADTLSPVGLNTVIGVAASDAYDRVVSWATGLSSNYGPEVDITAPGVDVTIAAISGEYATSSGTSISAGIVSGVLAQYIEQNPGRDAETIKDMLLEYASVDMLFRNETIYGTTPNRLVKVVYISSPNIWNHAIFTLFPVQKETTTTLTFTTRVPLATAEYSDALLETSVSQTLFKQLPWVSGSFTDRVLTLTVTPTADVTTGKYTVQLTSTDNKGTKYFTRYVLGVYENVVTELDSVELERYLTVDENNNTILQVTPAVCYYNEDCGKGAVCFGGFCADT